MLRSAGTAVTLFLDGMLEAMNSLIQVTESRAPGHRTTEHRSTMARLDRGKVDVELAA